MRLCIGILNQNSAHNILIRTQCSRQIRYMARFLRRIRDRTAPQLEWDQRWRTQELLYRIRFVYLSIRATSSWSVWWCTDFTPGIKLCSSSVERRTSWQMKLSKVYYRHLWYYRHIILLNSLIPCLLVVVIRTQLLTQSQERCLTFLQRDSHPKFWLLRR